MNTVSSILKTIGRTELASRLDVGVTTISAAAVANKFPAAWYPIVNKLCEEKGISVPNEMFNWRKSSKSETTPTPPQSAQA